MEAPTNINPGDNFFDMWLGGWQRYRRWRGGYWWFSTYTHMWWRHDPRPGEVEDYR